MNDLEKERNRLSEQVKQLKSDKEILEQNIKNIEQTNKTIESNMQLKFQTELQKVNAPSNPEPAKQVHHSPSSRTTFVHRLWRTMIRIAAILHTITRS